MLNWSSVLTAGFAPVTGGAVGTPDVVLVRDSLNLDAALAASVDRQLAKDGRPPPGAVGLLARRITIPDGAVFARAGGDLLLVCEELVGAESRIVLSGADGVEGQSG